MVHVLCHYICYSWEQNEMLSARTASMSIACTLANCLRITPENCVSAIVTCYSFEDQTKPCLRYLNGACQCHFRRALVHHVSVSHGLINSCMICGCVCGRGHISQTSNCGFATSWAAEVLGIVFSRFAKYLAPCLRCP